MDCQVLLSLKSNKINFRMSSAAHLLCALKVNIGKYLITENWKLRSPVL